MSNLAFYGPKQSYEQRKLFQSDSSDCIFELFCCFPNRSSEIFWIMFLLKAVFLQKPSTICTLRFSVFSSGPRYVIRQQLTHDALISLMVKGISKRTELVDIFLDLLGQTTYLEFSPEKPKQFPGMQPSIYHKKRSFLQISNILFNISSANLINWKTISKHLAVYWSVLLSELIWGLCT